MSAKLDPADESEARVTIADSYKNGIEYAQSTSPNSDYLLFLQKLSAITDGKILPCPEYLGHHTFELSAEVNQKCLSKQSNINSLKLCADIQHWYL